VSGPWERYAQAEDGPWAKYAEPMEPPTSAPRLVGQVAQNTNDAIANTVGAPVDLVAAGLRKVGVPVNAPIGGSESLKSGIDYVATLPGRVGDAVSQRSLSPLTESRTSRFEPENRSEKIAAGVGQGVGSVLSTMLPAGAIANAARPGTVTQGLAATLASQPVTQLASGIAAGGTTGATDDPLLGLLAGVAAPLSIAGARGAISPTTNRLSASERRLVDAMQRENIPALPSQATGSPSLRGIEETMARMPLSNTPMQNAYAGQRQAFNRAVLSRAGVTADDASPETMQRAFQGLGQQFDDLAARTTVGVDRQFADDVQRVAADYGRRLETDVRPVFNSYMDDLAPLIQAATTGQNPQIAGEVYRTIRSDITTRMRETPNLPLRRALGALVESLDDTMERSTSGALRAEWQQTRRHYANLMTIDRAMQGGTNVNRASGDIPFGALTGAVRGGDRVGYTRGRGDLNELARVGDYIASRVPNSGTPERLGWTNILTGGALLGGGAASGVGLGPAAVATATPWAVSRLYNTDLGRRYLTNQAAGTTDLASAYAAQAVQQALQNTGEPRQLARAMMRANEQRQRAAR
jgi:hypothetical protein